MHIVIEQMCHLVVITDLSLCQDGKICLALLNSVEL